MFELTVSHDMPHDAALLYGAFTAGWGVWFGSPDSARIRVGVGEPFFFEVVQPASADAPEKRHAHHGRFLLLEPSERVSLTWVTAGTAGVATTMTVVLSPSDAGTQVTLTHAGFASEAARDGHAAAWPHVLAQLAMKLGAMSSAERTTMATVMSSSGFPANRSIPDSTFIPVRSYPDLDAAVQWLHDVLECRERLRIPGHRVQMTLGNGAVVAKAWDAAANPASGGRPPATLMVRVRDIDKTYALALAHGATSLSEPTSHPTGERQAQIRDPAGHAWTLTQTIGDVDPASWGGTLMG